MVDPHFAVLVFAVYPHLVVVLVALRQHFVKVTERLLRGKLVYPQLLRQPRLVGVGTHVRVVLATGFPVVLVVVVP